MSRSSHGAVDAGSARVAAGWRWRSRLQAASRSSVALAASAGAATSREDDGRPRRHRDRRPTPPARSCPARRSAASPASRSAPARHRCPSASASDGKIKSWTLTLSQPTSSQRSFFNGFFGTPPEARLAILRRVAGHQPAPLQPARPGLDPGAQPLPGPDGQVRRLAAGRKGRHRRPHRPDLGPGLRPGPARQQRLARQPRTRQMHQLHRRPPGRTAGQRSAAAPPTAAATPRPACSTRPPSSRTKPGTQAPARHSVRCRGRPSAA